MPNIVRNELAIAATILALGIASAGYFASRTIYNAKIALNTAEVKGLAERRVEADRAYWKIQYQVDGADKAEVPQLYERMAANQKQIETLLKENGFEASEIIPGVIDYGQKEFRDESQKLVDVKHYLVGSIDVETSKVKQVAQVRAKLNELIARGLDIRNNAPSYYFTKLNDIKPAMLQEATKNARLAANEFASNAGVTVGGIREARQGGFEVKDVGEDYGDSKKIEKEVRLVTNITFFLTD